MSLPEEQSDLTQETGPETLNYAGSPKVPTPHPENASRIGSVVRRLIRVTCVVGITFTAADVYEFHLEHTTRRAVHTRGDAPYYWGAAIGGLFLITIVLAILMNTLKRRVQVVLILMMLAGLLMLRLGLAQAGIWE